MPPSRFGVCVWPTASKAVVDVTVKGWPEMALKIPLICQSLAFCPTEYSMLIFTKRIIYRSFRGAALFLRVRRGSLRLWDPSRFFSRSNRRASPSCRLRSARICGTRLHWAVCSRFTNQAKRAAEETSITSTPMGLPPEGPISEVRKNAVWLLISRGEALEVPPVATWREL
jgi:hypothetical protein